MADAETLARICDGLLIAALPAHALALAGALAPPRAALTAAWSAAAGVALCRVGLGAAAFLALATEHGWVGVLGGLLVALSPLPVQVFAFLGTRSLEHFALLAASFAAMYAVGALQRVLVARHERRVAGWRRLGAAWRRFVAQW
ncbi:MAG TPA: hypothetical protein VHM02_06245 [Thermoanaerobaculia bacterium]|nr:hypothetical protein [Thermoanaerobaculia bacterium]